MHGFWNLLLDFLRCFFVAICRVGKQFCERASLWTFEGPGKLCILVASF